MRVRRDVSSIPHRSASETWQRIVDLVTGADSQDVQQLNNAGGVVASIITDEHLLLRPILLEGVGPQLRVYCRYGLKAVEEGSQVDALTWNPTAGDWTMHVPCDIDNIEWIKESLRKTSPRIKLFDVGEAERAEDDQPSASEKASNPIVVDWNVRG